MLFINLFNLQRAAYSYACIKLQNILNKMCTARKTLEETAQTTFDNFLVKCMYLFAVESLQFEHEIHAQIDSLNCMPYSENKKTNQVRTADNTSINTVEFLCNYLERNYIRPYTRLLKDKHLNSSVKNLINNHLQALISSLHNCGYFRM